MANISAIKLPNGSTYDLVDKKSGYIKDVKVNDISVVDNSIAEIDLESLKTFIVTFTYDSENETWSCDKTAQQIYEAYEANKSIIAVSTYSDDVGIIFYLDTIRHYYVEEEEHIYIRFIPQQHTDGGSNATIHNLTLELYQDGWVERTYNEVEAVTNTYGISGSSYIITDDGERGGQIRATNDNSGASATIYWSAMDGMSYDESVITFSAEHIKTDQVSPTEDYDVATKEYVDSSVSGISVPTKTSDLTNDSGFISTETDPTVPSWAKQSTKPTYTASEVGALPDTTTIPSKTSDLTNDSGFITGMTILSYGSSTWQNFIDAYNASKVVYCRASSSSNPASGSQTRLAFMAYVNNATTPTEVEFQYYRSVSSHTASQQGDQVYVYKLNKTNGWSVTVREASVKVVAGTGLGGTYSNGTMTLTGPTKVSNLTNDSGFITLNDIPTTHSIPSGGTTGQILAKNSATDYDVEWADASGGAFIVTFTYDNEEDEWSCDKTAQEIYEAWEAGKAIVGAEYDEFSDEFSNEDSYNLYPLSYCDKRISDGVALYYASFSLLASVDEESISHVLYGVSDDGVTYVNEYENIVPNSRKINNKDLSSDITLTASDVGAQEPLVSGTNIKTINNQSLLGSGNISVISSGTSVPTANETAEFDSSAKMNSTNMTSSEVTDFVESLDISGGGGDSVPTFNTATITLTTAGWSNNSQTVTVQGVTASNIVIVNPAPASYDEYVVDNVRCTGQSTNSLTFTCDFVPNEAITVSVIITSVTAVYGGEVS